LRALCGRKRKRLGLASTFLAERINPATNSRSMCKGAWIRAAAGPEDADHHDRAGTGVAPFRAFLLDRRATAHPARTGCSSAIKRSDCEFLLCRRTQRDETSGLLTRLSLAWSRDGAKKFYVQDRMREVGRELWTWLAEGANIYICGDAKRMAKDVERALVDIVAQFGARSTDEAISFVGELKKKGRFQQDVY